LERFYFCVRIDILVRNSEIRTLAGFERELALDFTGGFKYYLEWMQEYDIYKNTLPASTATKDEFRHVLTLRMTKLLLQAHLL